MTTTLPVPNSVTLTTPRTASQAVANTSASAVEVIARVSTSDLHRFMYCLTQYACAVTDLTPEDRECEATSFHSACEPQAPLADYVVNIGRSMHLSRNVVLIAVLYMKRYAKATGRMPSARSIHRLTATALLLASKVFQEVPQSNGKFAVAAGLSASELFDLEQELAAAINFDLFAPVAELSTLTSGLQRASGHTLRSDIIKEIAATLETAVPARTLPKVPSLPPSQWHASLSRHSSSLGSHGSAGSFEVAVDTCGEPRSKGGPLDVPDDPITTTPAAAQGSPTRGTCVTIVGFATVTAPSPVPTPHHVAGSGSPGAAWSSYNGIDAAWMSGEGGSSSMATSGAIQAAGGGVTAVRAIRFAQPSNGGDTVKTSSLCSTSFFSHSSSDSPLLPPTAATVALPTFPLLTELVTTHTLQPPPPRAPAAHVAHKVSPRPPPRHF